MRQKSTEMIIMKRMRIKRMRILIMKKRITTNLHHLKKIMCNRMRNHQAQ